VRLDIGAHTDVGRVRNNNEDSAIHLAHQMHGSSGVQNNDIPQRAAPRLHGYDLAGGESGSPEQAAKFDQMVVMDPDLEWDAQIEIRNEAPIAGIPGPVEPLAS
jgi:hypothetical protein